MKLECDAQFPTGMALEVELPRLTQLAPGYVDSLAAFVVRHSK
jgi:hypothetical protein